MVSNGQHSINTSSEDGSVGIISKEDLWKDALEKEISGGATVQLVGLDSATHTVFARVKGSNNDNISIGTVVECMVDEGWRHKAKDILERKEHVEVDSYPPPSRLFELGAVWLLNESDWIQSKGTHAHRLGTKDEDRTVNWQDMTLRVHCVPDRFFAAHEYDWTKHCRGLLVDDSVQVRIGDEVPHVPVTKGLPDAKDGVIVYEDEDHGFAILNKPGAMPVHATRNNHAEDVVSMFRDALNERNDGGTNKKYVSVSQRHSDMGLDTDTYGLLAVATKAEFLTYFNKQFDSKKDNPVFKRFKCLVCVKDPDRMGLLEHFQSSGKTVTHFMDPKAPKRPLLRHQPKNASSKWLECQLRILQVGDENFRAACVRSVYEDSVDTSLAHRLWGPDMESAEKDLGVQYVMELQVELLTARPHQIRSQLAALGFPIVGDVQNGGGKCEYHSNKHAWNRMALQCCELSFMEPQWQEMQSKKELVPSERKCVFRLNESWWSECLAQYELYHQSY